MPVFSRFLKYFISVSKCGSIRRASEELNIAASAIDRQILQAEEQLQIRLFERLPSGLRLTAAGEAMLADGQRWMREYRSLTARIENLKGLKKGVVDILVPDALTRGKLPEMLSQIRQNHPGIIINIHVLASRLMGRALANGEADCALIFNPAPMKEVLVTARQDIPIGFVTENGHEITELPQPRFSMAAEYPLILPAPPLMLSQSLEELEKATEVRMNVMGRSDNIQMIKSMIHTSGTASILSYVDVQEDVEAGTLCFTPFSHKRLPAMALALCINPSRQLSRAARLVISALEASLPLFSPTSSIAG